MAYYYRFLFNFPQYRVRSVPPVQTLAGAGRSRGYSVPAQRTPPDAEASRQNELQGSKADDRQGGWQGGWPWY